MIRRARRHGMTFVEVLASLMIMSVVLPVAAGAILHANRTAVLALRKRDAAFLADQIMQESVGTSSWEDGAQRGDFDGEHAGWTWSLTVAQRDEQPIPQVTVVVEYPVQGAMHSESLTRLVIAEEAES